MKKIIILLIAGILLLQTDSCFAENGKYRYLFDLNSDNSEIGALNQPAGIAVDAAGELYVADTVNNRVVVFDNTGKVKTVFGKFGSGSGEFRAPMALAVDPKRKKLYVADSSNYRIQVFKTDGTFISFIDLNKDIGESDKKIRPIGIAVNSAGNVYVSDVDNNRIKVYSPSGQFLFQFGGFGSEDGMLCVPVGMYIDSRDKVYVVDMSNSRVQVFDKKGKFLLKIGEPGDTKGTFNKPKDVCVDHKGFIYVSDGASLVIQVFDQEGNFVNLIGAEKEVDLQFASPFGLAVWKNRLYITDRWRNSVRVYDIRF